MRPKWKGLGSIYFKLASRLSTIFFDSVITDSVEMSKIYFNKFKAKSNIIAYGSTMIKTNSNEFLNKHNLKKNQYYLIVGRLIPDNNSYLIINSFVKSSSKKKLVIVGDVPYSDSYADNVKSLSSKKVIFTGYICSMDHLTQLYENCFGYIHGHEFGGTNPTLINALDLNCEILALNTIFNKEMLVDKSVVFFEKNIESIIKSINNFEIQINKQKELNKNFKMSIKYNWEYIANKYEELIFSIKKSNN